MTRVAQGEVQSRSQGAAVSDGIANLYQEMIIDHARSPRNFREVEDATRTVEAVNPLCGDQLTLSLQLTDGAVSDIAFTGKGCAISQASASLMTMAVKGLRQDEALNATVTGGIHSWPCASVRTGWPEAREEGTNQQSVVSRPRC